MSTVTVIAGRVGHTGSPAHGRGDVIGTVEPESAHGARDVNAQRRRNYWSDTCPAALTVMWMPVDDFTASVGVFMER